MDKIVIEGGVKLHGNVEITGAKNASLPILVASLLSPKTSVISNIPKVKDVETILKVMERLGTRYELQENRTVFLETPHLRNYEVPYDLVRTMRASILVLGALLAREGRAKVSLPGGCAIGARPVDQHIKGFRAMGAKIHLDKGYILAEVDKLKGATICLDMPSVTATENLMMAATLAEGETIIENTAREPEIEDLAKFLIGMGAEIKGAGTSEITIMGTTQLNGNSHKVIGDRIEAGTFMLAAAITGGELNITGCPQNFLCTLADKINCANVCVGGIGDRIHVRSDGNKICPLDITTSEYPGFPTDMQAQIMALMTVADGTSTISETIFENRFMHVSELIRMGAQIKITGHTAVVNGVPSLMGAPVMATDLRASASLILAALRAKGKTEILRVYHLDRGYENIEKKLEKVGARIKREKI